jgi:hypothetical protein
VLTWNRGARGDSRATASSEIIGRHFSIFYPEEVRKEASDQLDLVRREGRIEREGCACARTARASVADVVITALFDAHGETTRLRQGDP